MTVLPASHHTHERGSHATEACCACTVRCASIMVGFCLDSKAVCGSATDYMMCGPCG
jgi:hypothetical protein